MGILGTSRWMCTNLFLGSLRTPLSPKYLRMFRHRFCSVWIDGQGERKVTCLINGTCRAHILLLLLIIKRPYFYQTTWRTRRGCGELLWFFFLLPNRNHVVRCTRWFIPLLILPLPSSPPYFLIIFLISMIIHARPWYVPHCHRPRLI